ncbi:MAG: lamin tail domain-containing protein [Tepidisphaeraceae bacterium]
MRMKNLILTAALVAAPVASASAAIVITEVHPNGSSTATYGADFFELTNTGSTDVDITGWKIDDNSFSSATAVAMRGLMTLPAGASAVFLENGTDSSADAAKLTAFTTAWFGSSVPSGLLVGFYGGSGVGLSSGGDGVEVFDSANTIITGVQFGATTAGTTLDNAAGLGGTGPTFPTISTNSVAGTNGAFTSPTGEVGSPGTIANAAVPEPASLALIAVTGLGLLKRRR